MAIDIIGISDFVSQAFESELEAFHSTGCSFSRDWLATLGPNLPRFAEECPVDLMSWEQLIEF